MKTNLNIFKFVGVLSLLLLSGPALGTPIDSNPFQTTIRGRVVKAAQGGGVVWVPSVRVDCYNKTNKPVASTYTDADGLYYLSNLAPGKYTIRINKKNYTITVHPSRPGKQFQDIAPIKLS